MLVLLSISREGDEVVLAGRDAMGVLLGPTGGTEVLSGCRVSVFDVG